MCAVYTHRRLPACPCVCVCASMNVRWCDGMCEPQPVGMPLQTVSFTASPPLLEEFHTASASRFIAMPGRSWSLYLPRRVWSWTCEIGRRLVLTDSVSESRWASGGVVMVMGRWWGFINLSVQMEVFSFLEHPSFLFFSFLFLSLAVFFCFFSFFLG